MKTKNIKNIVAILTLVVMVLFFSQTTKVKLNAITPPEGSYVISEKKTTLVPGVVENRFLYNDASGSNPVGGFVIDVKLGDNVKIMAATKDYNQSGTQTVKKMAEAVEEKTGRNVIAAVNADLNWNGNGISNGVTIVDGRIISDTPDTFFGIKKNGQAIIGNAQEYIQERDNLEHAVRAMNRLVENGINMVGDLTLAPRTAVGIKADGSVFFYVVEGRNYPYSVGISLFDLANLMISYGAVQAINLDGGGSTTYLGKPEGQDKLEIRAHLSDGVERPSISSLMVYSEKGDGNFNHAKITSEYNLYTPNQKIQLNAIGVDNAGGSAQLPSDLIWELEDDSFGDITPDGVFHSTDQEGFAKISLKDLDDNVVGEYQLEIRTPDEIEILSEEFSLGYDETNNFGMRVLYQGAEIAYKEDDLTWDYDSSLGTFNNNVFTSISDSEGQLESIFKVTLTHNGLVDKSFKVIVGQTPIILYDYENEETNELWGSSSTDKVDVSVKVIDRDSGEPVRFGDKSLRIDFDYSQAVNLPHGAYATLPSDYDVTLPGNPTSIGAWVYGTEENQGIWLRMGVLGAGDAGWAASNLTDETVGINWLGWKYVQADLSQKAAPIRLLASQVLRMMITTSTPGQPNYKPVGSVYFDDITVSYGTIDFDKDSPVVDVLEINDEDVLDKDNIIIKDNKFTLNSVFHDPVDKNTTGIENYLVYLDGINITERMRLSELDGYSVIDSDEIRVTEGTHKLDLIVIDGNGNETVITKYLRGTGDTNDGVISSINGLPVLGKDHILTLSTHNIDNIKTFFFETTVTNNISNYVLEVNDDFEIVDQEYLSAVKRIRVSLNRIGNGSTQDFIAKIIFPISSALPSTTIISHSTQGTFTLTDDTEMSVIKSFAVSSSNSRITAPLSIKSDIPFINKDVKFYVYDSDGNLAPNVKVFRILNGERILLGHTNNDGEIIIRFTESELYTLIAELDEDISFEHNGQTFASHGEEDGTPYNIVTNAVSENHENKNITWFSNSYSDNAQALVQYALLSEYNLNGDLAFNTVSGTKQSYIFNGSINYIDNYVVDINNVSIGGLLSGKEYVYRVGNGDVWSSIRNMKTAHKNSDVSFIVLGDIQTNDPEALSEKLNNIYDIDKFDFIIQTGDMIDRGNYFGDWNLTLNAFSNSIVGDMDIIHVLGNHEFYGNEDGNIPMGMYDLENRNHYSYQYGIVYIAVLNYSMNDEELTKSLEWLVEDANASNAKWKIVLTHQPPYYTNDTGDIFHRLLPSYAERAGIDFVISGHDHSYARTKPMIGGIPNDNGVIYMIAGAFGEKGYDVNINPDFNFEVATNDFESLYLRVDVTETKFTIKAIDSITLEQLDEFTKTKDADHDHNYILDGDRLICEECDYNRPLEGYSGFLETADGNIRYAIAGNFMKGIFVFEGHTYYFDEDGNALVGEHEVFDLPSTFDDKGRLIAGGTGRYEVNGETYYYESLIMYIKGWLVQDGEKYYFSPYTGRMYKGWSYVNGIEYNFSTEDGHLLHGTWEDYPTGLRYHDGRLIFGWKEIDGHMYYFSTYDGVMVTGEVQIWLNKGKYTFNEFGQLIKGSWVTEDGKTRHYIGDQNSGNNYKVGFTIIDNELYYFDESGYLLTGTFIVDGISYTTNNDGVIV